MLRSGKINETEVLYVLENYRTSFQYGLDNAEFTIIG